MDIVMKKSLGYSKLILSIMDMYSKNTILKVADFVSSPNQVKEIQEILKIQPTEEEFNKKIDMLISQET